MEETRNRKELNNIIYIGKIRKFRENAAQNCMIKELIATNFQKLIML